MFSMPPATATLMLPSAISWAAETIACAPEPQTRLTVSAGTVTGRAALTAAWRAGFILVPACTTLPMTTVSISSGLSCARATAAPIATAPSAGAGKSLSVRPKVPIAVRTGSAKITERCAVMEDLLVPARLDDRCTCTYLSEYALMSSHATARNENVTTAPVRPAGACNCFALRAAARHVTALYDELLAPVDLRVTQF